MSVTVNQPNTSVEVHTKGPKPILELTDSTSATATVGTIKEETTVVSQTATYAPSGDYALQDHILSTNPHPAYDVDIPSLNLIFENGLI